MGCGCNKKKEEFNALRQRVINASSNIQKTNQPPQPPQPQPPVEDRFKGMGQRQINIILRAERIQRRSERIKRRNEAIKQASNAASSTVASN